MTEAALGFSLCSRRQSRPCLHDKLVCRSAQAQQNRCVCIRQKNSPSRGRLKDGLCTSNVAIGHMWSQGWKCVDRPAAKATVALGTSCGHIERRRARVRNAPRAPIERAAAARPAGVAGSFRNEDANSGLLLLGSTAPPQGPRVMWL